MQTLQFESAWDKTISPKDRERIHQVFLDTSFSHHTSFELTPLWEAMNHKGELLVTVLIQNFSEQSIYFHHKKLSYLENNEKVASHLFTLPTLTINSETSMPWTFIFPAKSFLRQPILKNGRVNVEETETIA